MTPNTLDARTDFYPQTPGMRLFRLSLSAIQAVWPALAVRAAYHLFGTPLPPKWAARRHTWDAHWRVDALPFEEASITLYAPAVSPHAPVVLLVHGWGGHAGQMLALADAVAAQGWRPVLVDMPAHGRSEGGVSNLPQFTRAIDYVSARLQQQGHTVHAVVAHSMGANASAFSVSRGLPVARLVLLAPPASAQAFTRIFGKVFGLSESTRAAMQQRVETREGVLMSQLEPPASAQAFTRIFGKVFGLSESTRAAMQQRVETREGVLMSQLEPPAVGPRIRVPTLVVHDQGDRINAFADGQAYQAAIPGARLLATEGLGHRKLLKDPRVLDAVVGFLR